MTHKLISIIILLTTAILTSCSGVEVADKTNTLPSIKDVPQSAWDKLTQKKIYFGHQSVGFNIIDGIKDVMKENPQIKLNIVETTDPSKLNAGIFAHSRIGKNADPKSKIKDFFDNIRSGIGAQADIVFFKFCYVDIGKGSNIENLFEEYKAKMTQLEKDYPNIEFIHLTIPLRVTKTNWKTWLKELIGKGDMYEYAGNLERNEYNKRLLINYKGKAAVFDLAEIESTYPDMSRSIFKIKGKQYYSLVPEYTKDGGHLNEVGRKRIAEQFLIFLAKL